MQQPFQILRRQRKTLGTIKPDKAAVPDFIDWG